MKILRQTCKAPQDLSAITIHNTTSLEDVVSILVQHGCKDLTDCIPIDGAPAIAYACGGACDVYEWKLRESSPTGTIFPHIAIKTLRCSSQSNAEAKLIKRAARELLTWLQLDHHPNILPLLGLAIFNGRLSMVSPWMSNGNLSAYLRKHENSNADRITLCEQIRAGLVYIHGRDMVHGDLKPVNIMVSDEGRALIADFGNAILKDLALSFAPTTTFGMTHQYAPPEHLASETTPIATKQSDIYSFGMTVLEILTGETPFTGKNVTWVITQASRRKLCPTQPSTIDDDIWSILLSCWAHDPLKRPFAWDIHFPIHVPGELKEFRDLLDPLIHICGDQFASVFSPNAMNSGSLPRNNHDGEQEHSYEYRTFSDILDSGPPDEPVPRRDGLEIDTRELFKVWTEDITARFGLTSFQWFKGLTGTPTVPEYLLFSLSSEGAYSRKELWFRLGYRVRYQSQLPKQTVLMRVIGRQSDSYLGETRIGGEIVAIAPQRENLIHPDHAQLGPQASVTLGKRLPLSYLMDVMKTIHNEFSESAIISYGCWYYVSTIADAVARKGQGIWELDNLTRDDHWEIKSQINSPAGKQYNYIIGRIRQLEDDCT
ncbi:unnamed protein product [Rhizoctonia solani]|uniref:Protein kinase domain-containing protein n=1 Tax=Rhizoctonia solani TaxID=456999 RepID=A0A8H3C2L5_9AGAM|nr:unnamed protein product [Rhizoctonia solani]